MPSHTTDDLLAARYGRRPRPSRPWYRRPLPLAAAVLGAVLVLAYGAWVAVWQTQGPATTVIGYDVLGDRAVELRFSVARDPGTTVQCTVHALDASSAEVGLLRVDVPAGTEREVQRTVEIRTTSRAATALVESCSQVRG
ncbi:DUF4307 domain-containing protein [Paenibacillus sp. TRM 82003]|uniref:DUF4307 domain-containing protein n=1 Tax=Kineococcus sp. TRM81007 TaxID=2925831 RepID=UPI001F587269|nr:DUF4307 domain-containing protein [Kineococcus sp. TRM81007]MCI2238372.1 DUF4307 domain-containing protein [Kineococcus sp. TRM81007]MCI3922114.1 DUF4307 domain-containing protein [Paenibacillus sp. TRM 82003]